MLYRPLNINQYF